MQPIYILDACNILLDAALLRKYSKKVLDLTHCYASKILH